MDRMYVIVDIPAENFIWGYRNSPAEAWQMLSEAHLESCGRSRLSYRYFVSPSGVRALPGESPRRELRTKRALSSRLACRPTP